MLPTREEALRELEIAGEMNPGLWPDHCRNAAEAAQLIAAACGMDAEKAYILGLMHDIGRRTGIGQMRHVIDGYDYAMSRGWDEVARICLTHSFPIRDIRKDLAKRDVTDEQYDFIDRYIRDHEYNEYDQLIILCDALAEPKGLCILEKRFVDTTMRYGAFPFTVERWRNTFEFKAHFESICKCSIYELLPGIEDCIYR